MKPSTTIPIRKGKRLEQHAIFKELRRSPGGVRRVNPLRNLLSPVAYFLFLFFIGAPLLERIGIIGFVLVFVAFTLLFDELIWRFLVIPALDKELQKKLAEAEGL